MSTAWLAQARTHRSRRSKSLATHSDYRHDDRRARRRSLGIRGDQHLHRELHVLPAKAGKPSAPSPLSYTEKLTATGTNGNRTAVLTDIKTKVYGIVGDGKDFPTCSPSKIEAADSDTVCPTGAKVATGAITAVIGNAANFKLPGSPCDPELHVWNGGQGKLVLFFVDTPTHACPPLVTGAVPPFPATYKVVGKYLVMDTPIPKYVSFPLTGLAGSLTGENLNWLRVTTKVHGRTAAASASVACLHGQRPYSVTYTATQNGAPEVDTVSNKAHC